MRAVSGIWLAVCVVACTVCRAEPQFPYELVVGSNRVEVRSGPGREYYVTDHLSAGSKIEVYRRDAGGWLAIRPTSGSFSLVEKDQLQTTDGKSVAKVRRDGVKCRVGSRVFKVTDYVTHVRLRQGELVELYQSPRGTDSPPTDTDSQWVPIWPPAGEFRWVYAGDVQEPDGVDSSTDESSWQAKTDAAPETPEMVRVPPEAERRDSARAATAKKPEEPKDVPREEEPRETQGRRWVSPNRGADDDVGSLELELAMMVSREMRVWRLDALSDRVRKTLSRLENEPDRVRARRLLARISEFEDLLNRASESSEISSTAGPIGNVSTAATGGAPSGGNTVRGVTYDGTGWLVPVHASKGTVPPYALLDAQGDVLHYISPTPGLNLQRYVRKQIGVFGNRGYIPALNKPHVTAQRVVDLDRHLR